MCAGVEWAITKNFSFPQQHCYISSKDLMLSIMKYLQNLPLLDRKFFPQTQFRILRSWNIGKLFAQKKKN